MTSDQGLPPYSGGQQGGYQPGPPPSNNLVWAILTTIFCCLPFGIVSIVQAAKVNGLWAQGQGAAAQAAAQSAKKWAIISAVLGVILIVISIILSVTGALTFSGNVKTY